MLETLRADFTRIPAIIALGPPEQPRPLDSPLGPEDELLPEFEEPSEESEDAADAHEEREPAPQLGLF
jgi:hypothetical protein